MHRRSSSQREATLNPPLCPEEPLSRDGAVRPRDSRSTQRLRQQLKRAPRGLSTEHTWLGRAFCWMPLLAGSHELGLDRLTDEISRRIVVLAVNYLTGVVTRRIVVLAVNHLTGVVT